MKRFISITVVLLLMLIFIGCATMTPEQRKEESDLSSSVGNKPFVGDPGPEGKDLAWYQMHGR